MINLDQVRTLEWKVKQAVQLVVHLRRENDTLRGRLSDTEVRLQELEALLESVRASQSEMESGIRSALEELDFLEETPPVPTESVQADQLSYPPVTLASDAAPSPEPEEVKLEVETVSEASAEVSFEEEFAALAAAEAAALAEEDRPAVDSIPTSVELEAEVPPAEEASEPEQPGLGIF